MVARNQMRIWKACVRRLITVLSIAAAAATGVATAHAQTDWPNRPVRIIIPYAAGASTDSLVRGVAEKLQASLGQPFVVENRGGAAGALGTEMVAKSPADGYTILMTPQAAIVTLPQLRKMPYDPLKDFIHVDRLGESIAGIAVHPSVGAKRWRNSSRWPRRLPASSRSSPQASAPSIISAARC